MLKTLSKAISEPVVSLRKESSGFYVLVREEQPSSTRYAVVFKRTTVGIVGVLYDRKTSTSKTFNFTPEEIKKNKIEFSKAEAPKPVVHNEQVDKILERGVCRDSNDYLKTKKLEKFISGDEKWKTVKQKDLGDCIVVPYTTFEWMPKPVGANLYYKDKDKDVFKKKFLKGGYVGSFHPHQFDDSFEVWILGEGFRECFLAGKIIERANVLEVGGLSKYKSIIKQIIRLHPNQRIYIMGEKGSEEELDELKKLSSYIRISYPKEGKDFADYYGLCEDEARLRDTILCVDITNKEKHYKPLGVEDGNIIVYSKFLNSSIKLSPDKPDQVIRNCLTLRGFEGWKNTEKREAVSFIWEECVRAGIYQRNKIFGIGLWKHKENLFFNTGDQLYLIKGKTIVPVNYIDYIDNDFLLVKTLTDQSAIKDTNFKEILPDLEEAFRFCDWREKCFGSIFLGFLTQSVYGGVLDLRPNLWIFSNKTTSGKTWICNWVKEFLLPIMKTQEGELSSLAGCRQIMANNSILLHADEIAEEGTAFEQGAKEMLQFFRSASGSRNTVNLGTSQQQSIHQRIKFSTLLSCIDGRKLIKEQDAVRLIEIDMIAGNKRRFLNEVKPKLTELETPQLQGFLYYTLQQYRFFQDYFKFFENKLCVYPIGHRIRGLSSVLAAYSALYEDKEKGVELLREIESDASHLLEPVKNPDEELSPITTLCHKLIPSRDLPFGEDQALRFIIAARKGFLKNFGVRTDTSGTKLYISLRLAADFLNSIIYKQNHTIEALRKDLERSSTYEGKKTVRVGTNVVIVMVFDVAEEH